MASLMENLIDVLNRECMEYEGLLVLISMGTGILLVLAYELLAAFRERRVEKVYLARVIGTPQKPHAV